MKKSTKQTQCQYSWQYKDANRDWWEIVMKVEPTRKLHKIWNYTVFKEIGGTKTEIHFGIIYGQYDIVPTIDSIMLDYTTHITSVALGFVHYAERNVKE